MLPRYRVAEWFQSCICVLVRLLPNLFDDLNKPFTTSIGVEGTIISDVVFSHSPTALYLQPDPLSNLPFFGLNRAIQDVADNMYSRAFLS